MPKGVESHYRALSAEGIPSFATVLKVAKALSVRLHAEAAWWIARFDSANYRRSVALHDLLDCGRFGVSRPRAIAAMDRLVTLLR